jgi:HK97 family phage major capsid protein
MLGDKITELTAAIQALRPNNSKARLDAEALLRTTRRPSMASQIGQRASSAESYDGSAIHPMLKAALGRAGTSDSYVPGTFLRALIDMAPGSDPDSFYRGKAAMQSLGLAYADMPESSKATLGTTGATGGYVLPNNLVDTVAKPKTAEAIYANLVTVRNGVNVRGVDQPLRLGPPARMTFQDWGQSKTNVSETYGSYTANLGTLAAIYDQSKQYARFSAGAAEQDVMDELRRAEILGENFEILAGPGTGTVGAGDPVTGVYTALAAASAFNGYQTTFSGASNSTIAGAAAQGLRQAFAALAGRSRFATAVVMDAVTYFDLLSQGSDTAGFWADPVRSGGFTFDLNGALHLWGVPILWDPQFDKNTGTTKAAIAADWTAFKLFRGMEFRIDVSDQAGTRWDANLIGYRGECEIGMNASTGVNVGAAQLITALIP